MLKEVNRQPISISTLYGAQAWTLTWHINSLISQPSVWYASKAPRISKCVHKIMMQIWFMQQSCTNFERDWCDILKNPNKCHSLSAWQNTPKHYWGQRAPPIKADNGEYLNKEMGSYHTPVGPRLIKSPPRGLVHCHHISFTDKKSYFWGLNK